MSPLLSVQNISKKIKDTTVLKGISFDVYQGEVLCFLGPNGAGKTTTINILTAALESTTGIILYKGKPIKKHMKSYKGSLGIVPQNIALYEELSGEQNLKFFASLYGLRGKKLKNAVDESLDFAGLSDRRKDVVKTYSGGMKRRLNVACAIAHRPELVIMDEPTVGIDPQSRNHILESILRLREEGTTILYTTHYMEEVEAISTKILIMDHGLIITEGTKEKLKEDIQNEKHYKIEVEPNGAISKEVFFTIEGIKEVEVEKNLIKIVVVRGIENLDQIIKVLTDTGQKIKNIASETASLETVFLKLTGRTLRD